MSLTRRKFMTTAAAAALELARGPQSAASQPVTLRKAGATAGILAGCAVAIDRLRDVPQYAALIAAQAGVIVAENAMKFGSMRPSPTTFFFDDADYLMHFAESHKIKLRGHNFVWHRQIPDWFKTYATPENAEQILVHHIETIGGRYKGRIHSWDVVNEAIDVDAKSTSGFRNSPWQELLGGTGEVPRYLEVAFRTARRVDPKAMLVYNDYGIESETHNAEAKRQAVLQLLRNMQAQKIPIDALGIQSHINAGPLSAYGPGLRSLLGEVRNLGLKIFITELDVNDRELAGDIPSRDEAVAAAYSNYLDLTLANPAVTAVLTWGITDRFTWLNAEGSRKDNLPERCLPFDTDFQPKPAFTAELESLRRAPKRR